MRNIDEAGYTMAKSAVVTLTRSFAQKGRNGPWKKDGIKAFALCPWFADTELVRNAELVCNRSIQPKDLLSIRGFT